MHCKSIIYKCLFRVWWTITGNFGNILPIDWSKSYARQLQSKVLNLKENQVTTCTGYSMGIIYQQPNHPFIVYTPVYVIAYQLIHTVNIEVPYLQWNFNLWMFYASVESKLSQNKHFACITKRPGFFSWTARFFGSLCEKDFIDSLYQVDIWIKIKFKIQWGCKFMDEGYLQHKKNWVTTKMILEKLLVK